MLVQFYEKVSNHYTFVVPLDKTDRSRTDWMEVWEHLLADMKHFDLGQGACGEPTPCILTEPPLVTTLESRQVDIIGRLSDAMNL